MQQTRKRKKTALSPKEVLALDYSRAQTLLHPRPMLHLRCDGAMEIEYCREILHYSQTCIKLDMQSVCVEITGDELVLDTLQKDRITLHGRLFSVTFRYEKAQVKP